MDIAKKLREVVTSNFIEIVRTDEDDRKKQKPSAFGANTPTAPLVEPRSLDFAARREDAEARARRELDEMEAHGKRAEDPAEPIVAPPVDSVDEEETDVIEEATADMPADPAEEMTTSPFAIESEAEPVEDEYLDDTVEGPVPFTVASLDTMTAPTEATVETEAEEGVAESGAIEFVGDAGEEVVEAESRLEETAPTVEAITEEKIEAEATPTEPQPAVTENNPRSYVTEDGVIDFTRLIKDAKVPAVAFSAEQARKLIIALPDELPMRVKRMTMRATLDAVNPNTPVDPRDIVADAMLKRVHIGQFRDGLGAEIETVWRARQDDIARLRAEIARLEGEIEGVQEQQRLAEETCNQQISQYEQVILFFQTDEAILQSADKPAASEDDLPPFMRDDSVNKLLKGRNEETKPSQNGEAETGRRSSRR